MRTSAVVLLALLGCSKSQRKAQTTPPPTPVVVAADAAPAPPPLPKPPARPADCQLVLITTVAGQPSGTLGGSDELPLEAVVENPTASELSVTIQHDCPEMDARFTGFGDVKIYDTACMKGECAPGSSHASKLTVPAGGRQTISTTTLRKKMPCADAVAPGTYSVSFALPITSTDAPKTCAEPASVTVR